jgi:hypothetical protein
MSARQAHLLKTRLTFLQTADANRGKIIVNSRCHYLSAEHLRLDLDRRPISATPQAITQRSGKS